MIKSGEVETLAHQLFASRAKSQGPIYCHKLSATNLLEKAQEVIAEVGVGSNNLELTAPSAWHALIFLWWGAKRAATTKTVEGPFDAVFLRNRFVFRGQKADYDLAPSIRRGSQDEVLQHRLAARLLRASLVCLLRRSPDLLLRTFFESVSQREADCIAQHYKLEAGPRTFLLDWSFDPYVAIHFGTPHARSSESDDAVVHALL